MEKIRWTKARELAKAARRDRQAFKSAPWVQKASTMSTDEFRREVDRHVTGKESEPWEILYFRVSKGQLPVIDQTVEAAGLMLGSGKFCGYCLEIICADFLAGSTWKAVDTSAEGHKAISRLYECNAAPTGTTPCS